MTDRDKIASLCVTLHCCRDMMTDLASALETVDRSAPWRPSMTTFLANLDHLLTTCEEPASRGASPTNEESVPF